MKILGQRALASRAKIMSCIGWETGDDIQASWVECVETFMAGCPGSNVLSVAISIGASREMPQGNMHSLDIEQQKNKNPNWGWRHVTKYGQLASQCAEKGLNYSTVYSRMRKLMAKGMPEEKAIAEAISKPTKPAPIPDPRTMRKSDRKRYLISKAKKSGMWIDDKPDPVKKKRGPKPKEFRVLDLSSLIVEEDNLEINFGS